jgi:clan AA aspartic protease (TIGR02281 family)
MRMNPPRGLDGSESRPLKPIESGGDPPNADLAAFRSGLVASTQRGSARTRLSRMVWLTLGGGTVIACVLVAYNHRSDIAGLTAGPTSVASANLGGRPPVQSPIPAVNVPARPAVSVTEARHDPPAPGPEGQIRRPLTAAEIQAPVTVAEKPASPRTQISSAQTNAAAPAHAMALPASPLSVSPSRATNLPTAPLPSAPLPTVRTGVIAPLPMLQMPVVQMPSTQSSGNEAVASRSSNGAFAFDTTVNGVQLPMVFDTGATYVSLRAEDAVRLGFDLDTLEYSGRTATANGTTAVAPIVIEALTIGGITVRHVPALVARRGALSVNLLGQSFMVRLAGYNVEGNRLILRGY